MTIFSRRKRLLSRTPRAPKMSSRRQFHRALRRHPAWPMVMAEAAARARANQATSGPSGSIASGNKWLRNTWLRRFTLPGVPSVKNLLPDTTVAAWRRSKLRKSIRRNRVVLVTLLAVGGVMVLLTGLSLAQGGWGKGSWPAFYGQLNAPEPRFGAATTYDEARKRLVVFGGFVGGSLATVPATPAGTSATPVTTCVPGADACGPPIVADGITWELPNPPVPLGTRTPWQKRSPIHSPSPRGFAAVAYDAARQNVVLFGGAPYNDKYNPSGETWTWDGEDWTLHTPPKPWPDPRQNASMFYDAHRKVVVMFGGRGADAGAALNDTWTWNGSAWKIMPNQPELLPRHSAAVAYDECRAQGVMFGGTAGIPGSGATDPVFISGFARKQPFETWVWDGAGWTPRSPLVSPPARIGASMVYSHRTGNILLYGGLDTRESGVATAATDQDVWRWVPDDPTGVPGAPTAGGFWERMNSDVTTLPDAPHVYGAEAQVPAPPPRAYASFASYTRTGNVWLFGGTPWGIGETSIHNVVDNTALGTPRTVQVAYGDQYWFNDKGIFTGTDGFHGFGGLPPTPLGRRCANPVPIPSDDATGGAVAAPEAPKTEVRQGVEETGRQLQVLIGTDWPQKNRNTHMNYNGGPPNPAYTPAPDCPNRSEYFQPGFNAASGNTENGGYTHLVTDPTRNRIYQFFICDPNRGLGYVTPTNYNNLPQVYNLLIEAYDGTTLKPIDKSLARNVQPFGELQSVLAHDAAGGRFLLRSRRSDNLWELTIISQGQIEKGLDPVAGKYVQGSSGAPQNGELTRSYFNHPTTGRPKLFSFAAGGGATAGPPPAATTPPKLGQWDLETMTKDWEVALTGACTPSGAAPGLLGGVAMRSGNRVYTTCHVGNNQWAVARITITENTGGTETPSTAVEVFPGPTGGQVWGDPGAERMILATQTGGSYRLWTFDGKVSRWVGRTGIGADAGGTGAATNPIKWGFDPQSGRLYLHMADTPNGNTRGGVRLIDTRLTPVPQPLDFPQFASITAATPAYLPATAGSPRKVFIRNGGPGKMKKYPNWETVEFENEMFYRVLADNIPLPDPPDLSDLDALTLGVPETPGKTEVGFDAEGSAYGIRLRSIGGVWSAARPFQQMTANDTYPILESLAFPVIRHLIPGCVFPDRELMAGFVPQARLSDLDALARSSGLEVDSNSKSDLQAPTSRCNPTANASNFPPSSKGVFDLLWPLKNLLEVEANKAASTGVIEAGKDADGNTTSPLNGTPLQDTPLGTLKQGKDEDGNPTASFTLPTSSSWDRHFKEVICVGDALKTYQATVGNVYGSSDCVQTKGLVKATAKGSASGAGPASSAPFSVGEGYSTVTVAREPIRGVVVTSTATAKGIQLPGLTIGYVETKAVAWSNGRPGEKRASFERKICRVTFTPSELNPNLALVNHSNCFTDDKDIQTILVDRWNSGGGKNSQMYLPKYDNAYYHGSPGGYIAGVIKPLADAVEDELFAKDFLKEVPALEVHFYKNSPTEGDARQTLQLAAVRAVAGFNVQCNPDYLFSPQNNSCIALPDDPLEDEFLEDEDEEFFEEEGDPGTEGEWIPAEALEFSGEPLGRKLGRFLERLPVLRRLPIRQMGEALLAASVWLLLLTPLGLATRRFALQNLDRKV